MAATRRHHVQFESITLPLARDLLFPLLSPLQAPSLPGSLRTSPWLK